MDAPVGIAPPLAATTMAVQVDRTILKACAETQVRRSQPWKAHWPPKNASVGNNPYGFAAGEKIIMYGN